MIRTPYEELASIAEDIIDSCDALGDVIDGDNGTIEDASTIRTLDRLRSRFRSHGLALFDYARLCKREKGIDE